MKRFVTIISIITLSSALMFMTSCRKQEKETTALKTTTVSGYAYLSSMNSGILGFSEAQYVPNGTKIIFSVNTRELVQTPVFDYDYITKIFTAEVQDGKYSITLDTKPSSATNYTYYCQEYTAKHKDNNLQFHVSFNPQEVEILEGQTKKLDLVFNGEVTHISTSKP